MRLILVRHGEAHAGFRGVIGGRTGCAGLTPHGRRQAEALRDHLAASGRVTADVLLVSVLPRAIETAQIIAPALGLEIARQHRAHRVGARPRARPLDLALLQRDRPPRRPRRSRVTASASRPPRTALTPLPDPRPALPLPIDDEHAPIYTVGQVAGMLGVQPAFVRRLDTEAVVQPARSDGGQRRYTRSEIATVQQVAQMADDGMSLPGIRRILLLEAEVARLQREIARLEARSAG